MKAIVVVALFAMLAAAAINHAIDKAAVAVAQDPMAVITGLSPPKEVTYATLEEAGVAAIEKAYRCSHYYECGGAIWRDEHGRYVIGRVESSAAGDHVEFSTDVPEGSTLAATYHTHPCMPDDHAVEYYSPADIEGDVSTHTIGILGKLCTGEVAEFDPMTMKPDSDALVQVVGPTLYLTKGLPIGKIKVDGAIVSPRMGNP